MNFWKKKHQCQAAGYIRKNDDGEELCSVQQMREGEQVKCNATMCPSHGYEKRNHVDLKELGIEDEWKQDMESAV